MVTFRLGELDINFLERSASYHPAHPYLWHDRGKADET